MKVSQNWVDIKKRRMKHRLWGIKSKWPIGRLIKEDCALYARKHGYEFDISNPVLFTEKLQWYKLFYDHPDLSRIVDKREFKGYIREKLGDGHTLPLYGAWGDISGLKRQWGALPDTFVLKSTVGSFGRNVLIIKDKKAADFNVVKKELKKWLRPRNTLINSFCRAYYGTAPGLIAERYEPQMESRTCDCKLFCFGGKPHICQVQNWVKKGGAGSISTPGASFEISFHDLGWRKIDAAYGPYKAGCPSKPKHFDEMLGIAEKLSKEFPFVRVDFFDTGEKPLIGEMTFYPGGGLIPFLPVEFNRSLGDLFILPQLCQGDGG